MAILEAAGYRCVRSAASLGLFDVVAFGPRDVRCVQLKAGRARLSRAEREALAALTVPPNCSVEYWRFPDRCRAPLIERLVEGSHE